MNHYVLHNKKKFFTECCDCLINSYSHRKDTIESKKQYILNNWANINNLYKYKLSCPMESQISHNIADLFTSRPKGYSIKLINKLTKLRLLYKNNSFHIIKVKFIILQYNYILNFIFLLLKIPKTLYTNFFPDYFLIISWFIFDAHS